jgi:hypothetical protein
LTTDFNHDIFETMDMAKRAIHASILILILLSLAWGEKRVSAQDEEEPPARQTAIVVSFTAQEWWLIRWADNQVVCRVFVEHEKLPTGDEILAACGNAVYQEWISTPPCESAQAGGIVTQGCPGLYLFNVGVKTGEKPVVVDLPPPKVWITLADCVLVSPENLCRQIPTLVLVGEEPLPNEQITAIHATLDGRSFTCTGDICEIRLQPTPLRGVEIVFWAESSFGDTSEEFKGLIRIIDSGVPPFPGGGGWYVDILSTQWREAPMESCAQMWKAFPPIGAPPAWLLTPTQEGLLASGEPYHYLAGRLIAQGLVDTTGCPDAGLLPNGYANACGLERARPMVDLWQNQFDGRILSVAQETGLPAQLMKNLFAQESQFWPGVFRVAREYGLGQLTDNGADTILLWNRSFFDEFCPLVLDKSVCARGYLRMREDERVILRGALAIHANADCPDCPSGIDLTHTEFSVMLFAQTLLANCRQVSRTVFNATQSSPGEVSNYEDLWRFTLSNYHAGAGCLAYAIHTTWQQRNPLDWEHVSANFTETCQGVISYVEMIAR